MPRLFISLHTDPESGRQATLLTTVKICQGSQDAKPVLLQGFYFISDVVSKIFAYFDDTDAAAWQSL